MHLIISTRKLLSEYTALKIVVGSLCFANYWFWKSQGMIHEHISVSYFCYPWHSLVGDVFSEASCCSWGWIVELSQILVYNNFIKFNRKWEFQVDRVNFIFSLQKISFWYNASFEFFLPNFVGLQLFCFKKNVFPCHCWHDRLTQGKRYIGPSCLPGHCSHPLQV